MLSAGIEPVEAALNAAAIDHDGSWARFAWLAAIFVACFTIGLMSLVYFDQLIARRRRGRLPQPRRGGDRRVRGSARHALPGPVLSLMIATGIGLHNFSEGLAIGQSAAAGEHQPGARARDRLRASQCHGGVRHRRAVLGHAGAAELGLPLVVGLIGGGPTFFGTLLGQAWVSEALSIAFLALAAGSILYVVIELLGVCRSFGHKTVVAWGLTLGLMLGFATDFVLVAAGA